MTLATSLHCLPLAFSLPYQKGCNNAKTPSLGLGGGRDLRERAMWCSRHVTSLKMHSNYISTLGYGIEEEPP